jgi:xylulokinase
LGAGIGAGIFRNYQEAFANQVPIKKVIPDQADLYEDLYRKWKILLEKSVTEK